MKGDHFVLQRWEEDGRWHWELRKAYSRHGAIARSSKGYASPSAAKRSIRSACAAFGGASLGKGRIRIEEWKSLRPAAR